MNKKGIIGFAAFLIWALVVIVGIIVLYFIVKFLFKIIYDTL